MTMLKNVCSWTDSPNGQIVVGASVLILGLTHFGYGMGISDMGFGMVTIGNVAGLVGVVVGGCMVLNQVMGGAE